MQEVKYTKTDILSILNFTLPFILMAISNIILQITDRIMLSWYNLQAGVEVSAAMNGVYLLIYSPNTFLTIMTLILGNYNGVEKYKKIGHNVWNAIWIALFFYIIILICSHTKLYTYITADNCEKFGIPYVEILLNYVILIFIDTILSCVFFAIGKSYIVTTIIWLSSLLNILFNYVLIFQYDLGVIGGAYSSVIITLIKILILSYFYINLNKKYDLFNCSIDFSTIYDILYRGSSSAFGHAIELISISFVYKLLASYGENNPYLQTGFLINMFAIVIFNINCGFERSIGTLASNYLGNNDKKNTLKALRQIHLIYITFFIIISIISALFFDQILYFLNFINISKKLYYALLYSLICCLIMSFFDGLAWMYVGVLQSMKDVFFSFFANTISIIVFYVIPSYLVYIYIEEPVYYFAVRFFIPYTITHCLALFIRVQYLFYYKK